MTRRDGVPDLRLALSASALALLLCVGAVVPAFAAADETKLPRFVSLKDSEVNMREGPSVKNKVRWVFHRKGLPVEVLAQYDVWRRVRDSDGDIGWINANMLSRERAGLITGKDQAPLRAKEDATSDVVAQVAPGATGILKRCTAKACEMKFDKVSGWMDRARVWGIYPKETF